MSLESRRRRLENLDQVLRQLRQVMDQVPGQSPETLRLAERMLIQELEFQRRGLAWAEGQVLRRKSA